MSNIFFNIPARCGLYQGNMEFIGHGTPFYASPSLASSA
jgi:hypothetical protein